MFLHFGIEYFWLSDPQLGKHSDSRVPLRGCAVPEEFVSAKGFLESAESPPFLKGADMLASVWPQLGISMSGDSRFSEL